MQVSQVGFVFVANLNTTNTPADVNSYNVCPATPPDCGSSQP